MDRGDLRGRVAHEMELADEARAAGRSGRARVCARRAAGLAARPLLEVLGASPRGASAVDALRALAALEGLPAEIRQAARRLTTRVTEEFNLPHPEDPLEDARAVIQACLERGGV
jgi:HEPN domain-containing protein